MPRRFSIVRRLLLLGLAASLLGGLRSEGEQVTFRREVMAVISKAGCNAGNCHGNANGKAGLKLSLRGQDPDLDWQALVRDQEGRRVNLLEPEASLILLKPTAELSHEGGKRFGKDSPEYQVLTSWLRDGAPDSGADGPKLAELKVTGSQYVLVAPQREATLHVIAHFSDGTQRDVTRMTVFEPNNPATKASIDGVISREGNGESTVLVRYLNKQVPVTLDWVPNQPEWAWKEVPANNFVDEIVFKKLATLRLRPSELCNDEEFIRRAYLDLLGFVPSANSVRAFAGDSDDSKRGALIERLLTRGEFADFWALKWADLLKIEERQLDVKGMQVFHDWIRESIANNKPLDQFAGELIAARGKTFENPPANWWRANRDPITRAENTARVFLGVQLKCAQCHNHPFERWSQDDYYDWAALFTKIDYEVPNGDNRTDKSDKHEFRGNQTVLIKDTGSITNPRTGDPATARFLGVAQSPGNKQRDDLLALAEWLPHTPMFARMQVNRIWFHLLGRGLVDPVDDFRASNPASHPELLEALADDFVKHGYDLRHTIRTIMNSRVYQLSSVPNETNAEDETFHSRALVRRLTAEQLADSLARVTGSPLHIDGFPEGTHLSQIPEGRKHYKPLKTSLDLFSAAFGKPPRLIASECERSNDLAIPQAFQLISGPMLQSLLARPENRLNRLLNSDLSNEQIVDDLFYTTLSRPPSDQDRSIMVHQLEDAPDRRHTCEDLMWALVNAKEFLFMH